MSLGLTVIVIGLYLKLKALMCEIITTGNLNKQLFICFVFLHFCIIAFFLKSHLVVFSVSLRIFFQIMSYVWHCLFLC